MKTEKFRILKYYINTNRDGSILLAVNRTHCVVRRAAVTVNRTHCVVRCAAVILKFEVCISRGCGHHTLLMPSARRPAHVSAAFTGNFLKDAWRRSLNRVAIKTRNYLATRVFTVQRSEQQAAYK